MFYQQLTCTVGVFKAGVVTQLAVPANYLSVGFINHIDFNIVE